MDLRRKAIESGSQNGKPSKEAIRIVMNWSAVLIQKYKDLHSTCAIYLVDDSLKNFKKVEAKLNDISKWMDKEMI